MLEGETSGHLVLALDTRSKLCKAGVRCNGAHQDCSANYAVHRPMGNSEQQSITTNILRLEENNVSVSGVVCDGVAGELKGVRTEKLHCIVHMARCQKSRVQNLTLSQDMLGTKDAKQTTRFKGVLGKAISKRCTLELLAAREKHGEGGPAFLLAAEHADQAILKCFAGDHHQCHVSGVCKLGQSLHAPVTAPSYLPNHQYLKMQAEDQQKLQNIINFRLNRKAAIHQRKLMSTNHVEALHLRTLKIIPKAKTYIRNYRFRAHSAMHSHSLGQCGSLYTLAHNMKCAPVRTTFYLAAMQKREKYWHVRRQQAKYKVRRNQLAQEKYYVKRFSTLAIENGPTYLQDHDY